MKINDRWLFIHQEDKDEDFLMLSRSQYHFSLLVLLLKKLECLSLTSVFKCLRVKPEAYLRGGTPYI
jgi:hypothetical protein